MAAGCHGDGRDHRRAHHGEGNTLVVEVSAGFQLAGEDRDRHVGKEPHPAHQYKYLPQRATMRTDKDVPERM